MPDTLTTVVMGDEAVQVADASAAAVRKFIDSAKAKAKDADEKLTEEEKKKLEAEKKASDAAAELTRVTEAKDAEIATLKTQLADAQKPEHLDALVEQRIQTRTKARALLGDKAVVDGKPDAEIRRQVVLAKMGDQAKDWNDVQIEASFNTLAVSTKDGKVAVDPLAAAIRDSQPQTDARTAAYVENANRLENAWKKPGAHA